MRISGEKTNTKTARLTFKRGRTERERKSIAATCSSPEIALALKERARERKITVKASQAPIKLARSLSLSALSKACLHDKQHERGM
jgi:hypothetical protein